MKRIAIAQAKHQAELVKKHQKEQEINLANVAKKKEEDRLKKEKQWKVCLYICLVLCSMCHGCYICVSFTSRHLTSIHHSHITI